MVVVGPLWIDPPPVITTGLHPDPLIAALLARRGITDAAAAAGFLATHPRSAPNPSRLPGMDDAVARISRALDSGEQIAIFGDYDADGVTATALLTRALRCAATDPRVITPRLPNRAEGYGLNPTAITALAAGGATLLIAVDCGSSDPVNVAHARALGLDVVILDHHQMDGPGPPEAIVVSAQRLPPETLAATPAGYQTLAAVGVAYLLVAALARHGYRVDGDQGEPETDLLDYVALGTIADVVPLHGMNRDLVRDGLRRLRERPRPGVAALCRRAGLDPATVNAEAVAFKLAPRLNAAGRMGDPTVALDLLLSDDPRTALTLADQLEAINLARRQQSQAIERAATDLIDREPGCLDRPLIVLSQPNWSAGVLGIVAGRLANRYGRPAIVLNNDGQVSKGSARSVAGFDITAALTAGLHLLQAHGGHGQAAGLTVTNNDLPALTAHLEQAVSASGVVIPAPAELRIDADLDTDRLTLGTARLLETLEPYGTGNPQPLLRVRNLKILKYSTMGKDASHLKLHLASPAGATALMWGAAHRSRELLRNPVIDLVATLSVDHWGGHPRLQIEVKDFRPAT